MSASIVRTAKWLTVAKASQAAVSLLIPIILVRTFSKAEYGVFKQVDLVAALLVPFLVIGLDISVTYFVPRLKSDPGREISTAMWTILALSTAVFLLGSVFPDAFATVFGTGNARLLVSAIALASGAAAVRSYGVRALLAVEAGRTAAVMPLLIAIPRSIAIVLVAVVSASLPRVLIVFIIASILEVALVLTVLTRMKCLRASFESEVLGRQLRYGGSLGAVVLAKAWASRIDRYLVSSTFGPAIFAVYAVGTTKLPFLGIVPGALDSATAPRFSRLESENRLADMALLWRKRAEALLPLNLLVAVCLCVTAHWFIPVVFTEAYSDAIPVYRVFTITLVIQAIGGVDLILRALAAVRILILTIVLSLVLRIVLCLAVLPLESLALLVAVQAGVTALFLGIRLIYVRHRLRVPWSVLLPYRGLSLPIVLGLLGIGATLLLDRWVGDRSLLALGVAGLLWGVLIGIALWNQEEWRRLIPAGLGRGRNGGGARS